MDGRVRRMDGRSDERKIGETDGRTGNGQNGGGGRQKRRIRTEVVVRVVGKGQME